MRSFPVLVSVLLGVSCGGLITGGMGNGGGSGGSGGAGGGSATGGGTGGGASGFDGLPCDVANLLAAKCTNCHGASLSGGAPFSLISRADLVKDSPTFAGQSIAARSLVRMKAASGPMPPTAPFATAGELAAFEAWVNAGLPPGSCNMLPDAGPAVLTCASAQSWTGGLTPSFDMNPGWACQACHLGQNLKGQNPTGASEPERAYFFMGTVYPSVNERDLCDSKPPPNVVVEIVSLDGGLIERMTASTRSGNFASDGENGRSLALLNYNSPVPTPYRARVLANGKESVMQSAQTSGDCNSCHTERGDNGAPGRIVYPQ